MNSLLFDVSVCRKLTKGEGNMEDARLKKKARNVLLRSARGKRLHRLLEESPRNPCQCLAKTLSGAMGVIR